MHNSYSEFLTKQTKEKATPACLIWLLLIRAGIEQNPGPIWTCPICTKRIISVCVECSFCKNWLHVKCSGFKTSKERQKLKHWTGPCCTRSPPPQLPPTSTPFSLSSFLFHLSLSHFFILFLPTFFFPFAIVSFLLGISFVLLLPVEDQVDWLPCDDQVWHSPRSRTSS